MVSKVIVFELHSDKSVRRHEVSLTFPWKNMGHLYIVTNQNSRLHLLHGAGDQKSMEKVGFIVFLLQADSHTWAFGLLPDNPALSTLDLFFQAVSLLYEDPDRNPNPSKGSKEKRLFQYSASTKMFAVTDPTGGSWEVRLLLSPSEISRLSSFFNLTGFAETCLASAKYQGYLEVLCGQQSSQQDAAKELCTAATQFLCLPEDNLVSDYSKELYRILKENLKVPCVDQGEIKTSMVVGALVALVAAELASSIGGSENFDYRDEKKENQEDQREQIQQIIQVFDVMAELLTVSHQGKRVHIIFRNPCPDNWASGGKKLTGSGETFTFGMCHKVLSISESESEIQFIQSLQESYDLVSVFHLAAFVEHLLRVSEWRKNIGLLLKEENQKKKEIIKKLSHLAVRFVCGEKCQGEIFMKWFRREMLEKWCMVESIPVGGEVIVIFGVLVAVLAALTAKSVVDGDKGDFPHSEDEDTGVTQGEVADPSGSDVPENDDSLKSSITSTDINVSSPEITVTGIQVIDHNVAPRTRDNDDVDGKPSIGSDASTSGGTSVPSPDGLSTINTPIPEGTPNPTNVDAQEIMSSSTLTDQDSAGRLDVTNLYAPTVDEAGGTSPGLAHSPGSGIQVIDHNVAPGTEENDEVENDDVGGKPSIGSDASTSGGTSVPSSDGLSTINTPIPEGTPNPSNVDTQEIMSSCTLTDQDSAGRLDVTNLHASTVDETGGTSPGLADSPGTDVPDIFDEDKPEPENSEVGLPEPVSDMATVISTQEPNYGALETGAPSAHSDRVSDIGPLETSSRDTTEHSNLQKASSAGPQKRENSRDVELTTERERPPNADTNTVEISQGSGGFNSYWFMGLILLILFTMVLSITRLLPLLTSNGTTVLAVILAVIFLSSRRS